MIYGWRNPLIDKVPQKVMLQITETKKICYFVENNKSWNIYKLNNVLPNNIVDKITSILIPVNDIKINYLESFSNGKLLVRKTSWTNNNQMSPHRRTKFLNLI